jgi:hypothetical protein
MVKQSTNLFKKLCAAPSESATNNNIDCHMMYSYIYCAVVFLIVIGLVYRTVRSLCVVF